MNMSPLVIDTDDVDRIYEFTYLGNSVTETGITDW